MSPTRFLNLYLLVEIVPMTMPDRSRRAFLKSTAAVTAVGATTLSGQASSTVSQTKYDAKGLPTIQLGKTGLTIPRLALGCGSRFLGAGIEEGQRILNTALDLGLYYWDTANNYQIRGEQPFSETRLGPVLKERRDEIIVGTKLANRTVDGAKRQLEDSLARLQTDYLDILNIHSLNSLDDAKRIGEPGGIVDLFRSLKEQGVARSIGFTGHTTAEGMKYAAENYGLDFMLMALNHQRPDQPFEQQAVPAAAGQGMGVMMMKVVRPREGNPDLTPQDLIRYSLSVEGAHGAVVSMASVEIVKQNAELLRTFQPMKAEEMDKLSIALQPFFDNAKLPWMHPQYVDGIVA